MDAIDACAPARPSAISRLLREYGSLDDLFLALDQLGVAADASLRLRRTRNRWRLLAVEPRTEF